MKTLKLSLIPKEPRRWLMASSVARHLRIYVKDADMPRDLYKITYIKGEARLRFFLLKFFKTY
jgi:hypothetical protein